jgi:hypothetical protein
MTSHVNAFDGREGGTFRIALTYDALARTGKTSARTDWQSALARLAALVEPG